MSADVPAPLGKLERDKQLAMLLKLGRRRPDAIAELKYYVEHARPLLVRGFPMDPVVMEEALAILLVSTGKGEASHSSGGSAAIAPQQPPLPPPQWTHLPHRLPIHP